MLPDLISPQMNDRSPARHGDPFTHFQRSMSRMMRDFFGEEPRSLLSGEWPMASTFVPRLAIEESDDKIALMAELPGLTEKDVEVQIDKDYLTIKGEKKHEHEAKEGGRCFSELSYGSFERTVRLPSAVDKDKVAAKFDHGVLTIEMPKTAESKRDVKKIPIKH
jgi:HSP20 family protein